MKKRVFALLLALCLCSIILPTSAWASNGNANGDAISILSVTPTTATVGMETTYTATISYTLSSQSQGIIYLGFNTENANSYRLYAEQIVSSGTGTVTLSATVIPSDWSAEGVPFAAFANLSPYPHEESWQPMADDSVALDASGAMSYQTLPDATQFVPYSVHLDPLFSDRYFKLESGQLPAGLSIRPDGVLTGMPTELGVFRFSVHLSLDGMDGNLS